MFAGFISAHPQRALTPDCPKTSRPHFSGCVLVSRSSEQTRICGTDKARTARPAELNILSFICTKCPNMCTQSKDIFLGAGSPWSLLLSLRRDLYNPHLESMLAFQGLCSKAQLCKGVEMCDHVWKHSLLPLSQKTHQHKALPTLTAVSFC